jgi:lysine decarboxylase
MSETPQYDAYRRFLDNAGTPFTVPGHKRNPDLIDPLLALDGPQYGGVEDRRVSTHRLAAAERLAGELWGRPGARTWAFTRSCRPTLSRQVQIFC